jgi:hypothetical protein
MTWTLFTSSDLSRSYPRTGPSVSRAFHLSVVAFLALLTKQVSKRSTLIEIRDSSLKEGRYRARRVPNVNKSVVLALAIERLVLMVNLALAGTVFLFLNNMWAMYCSPDSPPAATVASCIGLMILAIPVPAWLTIRSTGTLVPVTRTETAGPTPEYDSSRTAHRSHTSSHPG